MNDQLVAIAIAQAPAVIAGLKALFTQQHPDQPTPSDAEVRAAYVATFARELAIDDAWIAQHPNWNIG